MLKNILYYLLFIISLSNGCTEDTAPTFPDFSNCECFGFAIDIVCGEDGRTYLNSCFAQCLKIEIVQSGSCPNATNDPNDTMKWAIELVCIPVLRDDDPKEIRILGDGSVLYQNTDGSYFRGTQNQCRCLPPSSLIGTPFGNKRIDILKNGDQIWTHNARGERISQPINYIRKVPVTGDHKMIHLVLEDGRRLQASPLHPDAFGNPISQLAIGDCLDGSLIIKKHLQDFDGKFTWDLIPAGDTGLYFANDILISSTLSYSLF